MSERYTCTLTLLISGHNAQKFLTNKGLSVTAERVGDDAFVVGRSTNGVIQTSAGDIGIDFGLVTATNNREVVLVTPLLRRRGLRGRRQVSVRSDTGTGTQQIAKGIMLSVSTDAPVSVFERNKR